MLILLVRELARNPPPVAEIEFHGNRIRLNDAKAARLVTAASDVSFTLREQFASNSLSPVLTKYPQVAKPLLIRNDHTHNLFMRNCTHANGQSSWSNSRGTGSGAKRRLTFRSPLSLLEPVPSRIRRVAVGAS
jgi:hypothetical protein